MFVKTLDPAGEGADALVKDSMIDAGKDRILS